MDWGKIISDVLSYWILGLLGFVSWFFAKFGVKSSRRYSEGPPSFREKATAYFYGILAVSVITFVLTGGSETYFPIAFLTFVVPVMLGIWMALERDKHLDSSSRKDLNDKMIRNAIEAERNSDEW